MYHRVRVDHARQWVSVVSERLDLWAAAAMLRLHPYLLLKCIKYQARRNGGMKLAAQSDNGQTFFIRGDLTSFDEDLRKPWVASRNEARPDIPDYFEDLLRHESAFVCGLCDSPLATDFAHIEPWEACLHHHPHNLICLCSACHRGYDRERRITKDAVAEAKARLLERLMRFFQGKTMSSSVAYMAFIDLCRKIDEYLIENSVAFHSFGPESQLAKDLSSMDVVDVWHKLRKDTILPNNDTISRLLITHRALYDQDDEFSRLADRFLAHSASYKAFVEQPHEAHNNFLFPTEFAQRVRGIAGGQR